MSSRARAEIFLLFHHVHSQRKRASMRAWALGLEPARGPAQAPVQVVLRIGKPGRLYAAGSPSAVHEYGLRVKQLRWQSVRLEATRDDEAGPSWDADERGFVECDGNAEFLAHVHALREAAGVRVA